MIYLTFLVMISTVIAFFIAAFKIFCRVLEINSWDSKDAVIKRGLIIAVSSIILFVLSQIIIVFAI